MEKSILLLAVVLHIIACTTTGPSFEEDEVLQRIGGQDETPTWADGSKVMWEQDQEVVFANIVRMSGDARTDACMKAAALGAKAEMLKHIKQSITFSGQLDESSVQSDPAYESLTAFLSQGDISGAKVSERYWEKKVESDESGVRVLRLSCAAKVAIKKADLLKQMRAATNPKHAGNSKVRDALIHAQESFINDLGQ